MDQIVYIGNEPQMIDLLHIIRDVEIAAIICEEKKKSLYENKGKTDIPLYIVNDKKSMLDAVLTIGQEVDYGIMYSFGIIIPVDILNKLDIYNFHPGDLFDNRGSSPINWSILNNEKQTKMSLHKIDERIDCGELIVEHVCKIYDYDVPSTLRARMEGEIPSMLLELYEYLHGEKKSSLPSVFGPYKRRITENDYEIKPYDEEDRIKSKIRSQYDYEGAFMIIDSKKEVIRTWREYLRIVKGENN